MRRRIESGIGRREIASRRAAAVVETAIVIPVLMLLALGCADFGRVFHTRSIVANAARGGAGYGSTHGFTSASFSEWQDGVRASVIEEMQNLSGFTEADLSVEVAATTDSDGRQVTSVQVTYPFRMFVAVGSGDDTLSVTRRIEMRRSR